MKYSIIYIITNKINNKSYIGKTKSHYGEKPYGAERRFKTHLYNAVDSVETYKNHNDCPKFYNAIRKYGKDNFFVNELIRCGDDIVNYYEKEMIKVYNTLENGYNIASGGLGRSIVDVDDEIRKKLSKNKNGELNVIKVYKNNDVIGYKVRRVVKGKEITKKFTYKLFSLEENYKLAKEFLENLKNENKTETHNRDLPKHIRYCYDNKRNIIGYRCELPNKKSKVYSNKKLTMEEKYKLICDFKDNFKSNNEQNKSEKSPTNDPQPSS